MQAPRLLGLIVTLGISIAGLARADDATMSVSPEIVHFYEGDYKHLKAPRAIAVAADGWHYGYTSCPEYRCYINPSARELALRACAQAGGVGCRIFAIGDDIEVNYIVVDRFARTAPAAPAETVKHAMMSWTEADVRSCFGPPRDNDVVAGLPRYRFIREDCTAYVIFKNRKVLSVEGYGSESECWKAIQPCRK